MSRFLFELKYFSDEEYNVEPVKRLKKKKTESFIYDFDSVDLSKTVYEHLYNHNDIVSVML